MEPKLPMSNLGPERSSGVYSRSAEIPSLPLPERRNERDTPAVERLEISRQETLGVPTLPPPIVPAVVVPSVPSSSSSQNAPSADDPLVANDDDLIEKEWVNKAKQIIANTRDDPYRRELEVGRLQADYLKKRYGKDLGASQ